MIDLISTCNMQYKKFGKTDLEPSVIGLGAAPIGSRTSRDESTITLNKAFESGITFYDTAPSYGQGASEAIIGEVFRKQRDKVIITTKVGSSITPTLQLAAKFKPIVRSILQSIPALRSTAQKNIQSFVQSQTKTNNYEPDYIVQSVEQSLKRLHSDYIDLLLLHSPSNEVLDRNEVFDVLQSLKCQGKIRYYGVSTGDVENALECLRRPELGISALQVTLNLFEQDVIDQVLPLAEEQGIAIVAREPFAHGKLISSSTADKGLSYLGPLQTDDRFAFLCQGNSRKMTQAALQFILQTQGVSVALPGMSKVNHVYENIAAVNASPLTDREMKDIRSMAAYVSL